MQSLGDEGSEEVQLEETQTVEVVDEPPSDQFQGRSLCIPLFAKMNKLIMLSIALICYCMTITIGENHFHNRLVLQTLLIFYGKRFLMNHCGNCCCKKCFL